jgi:hypothetical protein
LIVIEGNSKTNPCSAITKFGTVVTVKYESPNTDILCARHVAYKTDKPFLCYKWPEHKGLKAEWVADHVYWDKYFQSFNPKHPDPSSGTCAIFCVVERYAPSEIGVIGMDWVLDGNPDWFHDARAELAAIRQVVKLVDLRDRRNNASE